MATVYEFKPGAHIPKGVTPEGVAAERDRIKRDFGKPTIENSVDAVLKTPEEYPNLRAFGPADDEDAMRQGIARGIRHAYQAVVIVRRPEKEKTEPRYIRVFHSVKDDDGDLVYEPLTVIRESPSERRYLIKQLRRDADLFADKMRDTFAEIEEIA